MPEVLDYSACPIEELGFRPRAREGRRRPPPRFGLEIEMRGWNEDAHLDANRAWSRIQQRADTYTRGYCIAADDSSICGDNPAELKTVPLTKWDHALFHNEMAGRPFTGRSYSEMRKAYANPRSRAFFPDGTAWSARSCGIHITVSEGIASELTWNKLLVWLNCHKAIIEGRAKVLFLRDSNSFCTVLNDCRLGDYTRARNCDWGGDRAIPGVDKYSVLRVKPGDELCEFRGFRSSLNARTIMRNIEVVESLLLFMADMPVHFLPRSGLIDYGRWLRFNEGKFPFLTAWIRKRAADSPLRSGFLSPTQE